MMKKMMMPVPCTAEATILPTFISDARGKCYELMKIGLRRFGYICHSLKIAGNQIKIYLNGSFWNIGREDDLPNKRP
jgi:hypothetical protein